MKLISLPILGVIFFPILPGFARAQVGLSKADCDLRYKKPLTTIAGGTNTQFASYIYRTTTHQIQVGFEGDVAAYALLKKLNGASFNAQELEAAVEASSSNSKAVWLYDGTRGALQNWRRSDKSAFATYDKGHHLFMVWTAASGLDPVAISGLSRLGL